MGVYIELPKEWAKWSFDVRDIHDNVLEAKVTDLDLVRCGECKHLEVINKAPIYAHCHKWSYDFKLWQEDTRKSFCSYGERRADEEMATR